MLKMGILGLGQAGSNIAEYAIQKGFKSVVANTAKIDLSLLKYVPNENRIYLGGNGAGRNRDIGKQAMVESADKIYNVCKNQFENCDIVFIAASGGGGTGSGSLPIAIDILSEMFSTVNIIYILPDDLESPSTKINALDCFSEISQFDNLGSVFIIDNQISKEKNSTLAKYKIHSLTNEQLINSLVEINELTEVSSYTNNFDERDFLDLLMTRGCTLISKTHFYGNKNITNNDIAANIQKSWKNSYSPQYDLNNIIKAAMLAKIKESESRNVDMEKIFNGNIPYDIKDSFYSNNNETTVIYTIFSGLEFPNDRLQQIKESIEKVQDNLLERFEKSKNQKVEGFSWKLKESNPSPKKDLKNINLSDKLNKYK